ncbi:MAG: DUF1343 domain-containing protein [Flavobacteriales bacterium]|nr:DUF1343 domain-containing protein [Flavobacteriales bacterium]
MNPIPEEREVFLAGSHQLKAYKELLLGKSVAVIGNQTSMIGNMHLVDALLRYDINVTKIFSPEHGFRGVGDAGEHLADYTDAKTGLPVVSLYGNKKKPSNEDLDGIDVVVFDIQDVGVRFYTYISTMTYAMEACAENDIQMIVMDRANPNGHFVDGPVLDPKFSSFVGLHKVPIVYGMTMAEYALMVNGEGWLKKKKKCDLVTIPCKGYDHDFLYKLPIKPSPNLPNMSSIYLYPSLCLFEGTTVSIGRGTKKPFQSVGHPKLTLGKYSFTPESIIGASLNPKHKGVACQGFDLSIYGENIMPASKQLNLFWLLDVYKNLSSEDDFFNNYFNKLAGNSTLKEQIIEGKSEAEIRKSWEKDIAVFMEIRKKYLLYPDFSQNLIEN